jgi:Fur family ferric uptake transcriptional regulator
VGSHQVTIDDLIGQLRERGQRATTARRAVLAELLAAGDRHLTADELARRIHRRHPVIHLSTVYRTLDALADAGIISRAPFNDQSATYHLTTDVHHHAVCTRCGATINLGAAVLEPLRRRLLRDHGFHADPHHLTIEGCCASCAPP